METVAPLQPVTPDQLSKTAEEPVELAEAAMAVDPHSKTVGLQVPFLLAVTRLVKLTASLFL